jgi:hypothetical protein
LLDNIRSSWEFHLQIETFSAFCRREWRAIAFFGGGFCVAMLAAILLIDPAFFYPRLQTDPLNYWLKAKSLVENGHTAARWAVNIPPFSYAAMPGVLRAPLLLLFDDFDAQLRAIQILNIPIAGFVALLSAYILSWAVPAGRHWIAIGFAFAFTLLNPVWVNNVFLPLVDAPYALFTLTAIVISLRLVASGKRMREQPGLLALYIIVFLIAFLLRFTAPVLIVFPAVLALGRWHPDAAKAKRVAAGSLAAAGGLAVLVYLNADAIFGRYARELVGFAENGEKIGMILNFAGAAVPSQLIPNFLQGFVHPPILYYYYAVFFSSKAQAGWLFFGLAICAVVVVGIWQARRRFLPEILYFLASAPVLALMMPSTSRYLKPYQAFVWIFFYLGAAWLYKHVRQFIPAPMRSRAFAIGLVTALVALVIGIRAWRLGGTASEKKFAVTLTRAPQYVTDVASVFRGLRNYIETLPAERTLLVSDRGSMGRWKAISGRDYYYPDSAIKSTATKSDLYLVVECGTMEGCQYWDEWRRRLEIRASRYGTFQFDSVYAIARPRARAEVYRIKSTE